jgi:DNA processing protein
VGGVTASDPPGEPGHDVRARIELSWLAEPGDPGLGDAVERMGAPEVVAGLRGGRLRLPSRRDYAARLAEVDVDASVTALRDCGGRVVVPGDPEWPTQLDDLGPARPLLLFVRGRDLRLAAVRSVAVVGARAASAYGVTVAADLCAELVDAGWAVISGGAYGIDAAAHRGALSSPMAATGRSTVAVLACGVDVTYPLGNAALLAQVAQCGTVVSELPPGRHPTRSRFLQRNRVIAALTRGTVVVEAARRSGALNTAHHAGELNRPVMAVPGPVGSAASQGVHALIRDARAQLVVDAGQVLEGVGAIGDLAAEPVMPRRVTDSLDPVALRVFEAIPGHGSIRQVDIVVAAGVDPVLVGGALNRLALLGLVQQQASGWSLTPR